MPEIELLPSQLGELTFFLKVNLLVSKFFLNETNSQHSLGHFWKRSGPYSSEGSQKAGPEAATSVAYPKSATGHVHSLQAHNN